MPTWFERLTGFSETTYAATQAQLQLDGEWLTSSVNGARWAIGHLETPSLGELRARVAALNHANQPNLSCLRISNLVANARDLHATPEARGALIQVASQFNLLEMVGPHVSPEDGVGRYEGDHTQGPACAVAAGPATIYRNYLVPVAGGVGQTRQRQINTLQDLLQALPGGQRVAMQNGYALVDEDALASIHRTLTDATPAQRDAWRAMLRIGVHGQVEVTARGAATGQRVSQAFCSALPVSYNRYHNPSLWEPFARLVLEAAYEATLLAAVLNAAQGGSNRVYLTLLGGGAFGNVRGWILDAMRDALTALRHHPLDVVVVSFGRIDGDVQALATHPPAHAARSIA